MNLYDGVKLRKRGAAPQQQQQHQQQAKKKKAEGHQPLMKQPAPAAENWVNVPNQQQQLQQQHPQQQIPNLQTVTIADAVAALGAAILDRTEAQQANNGNVMAAVADNNNLGMQQQAFSPQAQQVRFNLQEHRQQQQVPPPAQRQSQQQLQLLLQQMLQRQRQQQQQQSGQRPQQQHPKLQAPTTSATTTATPSAAGAAPACRTALIIAGGAGNPPSSALAQQAQFATTMETVFRSYITDSVYNKCMKVKGMTTKMAVEIFQIKQFLRLFVCEVPEDFRPKLGTLNNAEKFEEYFTVLLDRALEKGDDHKQVQRKAWMTLKATVNMLREVPQCLYGINYIAKLMPQVWVEEEEETDDEESPNERHARLFRCGNTPASPRGPRTPDEKEVKEMKEEVEEEIDLYDAESANADYDEDECVEEEEEEEDEDEDEEEEDDDEEEEEEDEAEGKEVGKGGEKGKKK